ncbi:TPR repeat-containing protein [Sphingobium faniae]|nr:TPR repeat-containing protein [Sphingobium faniae]
MSGTNIIRTIGPLTLACLGIAAETAMAQTNAGGNSGTGLSLTEETDRQLRDYRWQDAMAAYRSALAADPNDAESWRALGKLLRWNGQLRESREAYEKALQLEPDSTDAALGVAVSYRYDHDFGRARARYADAAARWPDDSDVERSIRQFRREASPRLYAFYENDLSFESWKIGGAAPFLSREEVYYEHEQEERPDVYLRKDNKVGYIHYFGVNHFLELTARFSDYRYDGPVSDFSAIDRFQEYRVRYAFPITHRHVVTARYTARPTRLENSGATFTSHKVEAEIRSQWNPRFATVVGTGALRDLDDDAASVHDLRNTALVRIGAEYALTRRFRVAANYITNPDLDNTIRGTALGQLNYQINDSWSALYRLRHDDYKRGFNQDAHYLGIRYSPGGHIWAEGGMKYVKRGSRNGVYPLISIVLRM